METLRNNKSLWRLYETELPHSRICDPACGPRPAEKLSSEHLQLLRNAFARPPAASQTQRNRRKGSKSEDGGMTMQEFQEVLRSVIGPDLEDTWVERFFREVDVCSSGRVQWPQLCSYLLLDYTERQRASIPAAALLDTQPEIRHCSHNKREPTVRSLAVCYPPPLRYITVSKGGQVTVWDSGLHILRTLALAGDPTEEVANTRRFRGWVTDAVYMSDVHRVAIATDCRDLHFLNVSSKRVFEEVHLYGFRSILTALCYWHDTQDLAKPPLLLLGDEKGGVHLMWFLNRSRGLFKKSSNKKRPQRIFFPDLGEHSDNVSYQHIPNIHQEPVNRIMFEPDTDGIVTSSESDTAAVVFVKASTQRRPLTWRIEQGVKCFDYSASLQLMVTGGCDRAVRLWSRYVTSSPVATLPGHRATVLDVAIYPTVGQVFSYSRDAELRIWDISTHRCLKTIRLQFPCLQPGQIPEHGSFPFLLLPPPLPEGMQPHLVVACKDYLAVLRLSERRRGGGGGGGGVGWSVDAKREFGGENSRAASLSCAVYNPTLKQVVAGHVDSSVCVWDVETGRRWLLILNAHGEVEVTCMTLDSSHRRLITGARNGTVKVWDLLNGLNLHKLEPVTNSEVSGLTCFHDNKLLAVGWSKQISQYEIAGSKDMKVKVDASWRSRGVHKSNIVAVRHCSHLGVVATASYDGEIIIWKVETQEPLLHLKKETEAEAPLLPVDGLLFLQRRARDRKLRHGGVLVSSRAGRLHVWGVTGEGRAHGQFDAVEQPGQRVLSLSSDQLQNTILASGDTLGCLQIWDISGYALDLQRRSAPDRPPVLQSWKAHDQALACVEVLEVAERLLVFTASVDGSTRLWTKSGDHVGSFGQQLSWNITDPETYDREKQNQDGDRAEERTEEEVGGQTSDPINQGPTSQEECCSQGQTASSTGFKKSDQEQPQQPMYPCEDSLPVSAHPLNTRPFDDTDRLC